MSDDRRVFLATELASRPQFRVALVAVLASAVIFVVVSPFARFALVPVPAFVPIYVSILVVCDVITAVLLLGQFNFLRLTPLLVLAMGYAFTASVTIGYALFFPGLFAPIGFLDAGTQSSSATYMFWHGGFPLFVIAYALSKGSGVQILASTGFQRKLGVVIFSSVAGVLAAVSCFMLFASVGHDHLPVFIEGNRTTDLGRAILAGDWILSLVALFVLWFRKPHTVIDLWLMVVMCVWLCDIGLAAVLNSGRYDFGWYFGRIYGLLAASALLVVLLVENGNCYARLVRISVRLEEANSVLEQLSSRDGLTGIANRRAFDIYLEGQIAIAKRFGRDLALVLCDVDGFKAYNDRYGHQAGDDALREIATALRSCCRRPADMAARYGGDEFALILPDTDIMGASMIADAARDAVERLQLSHPSTFRAKRITISGGVAALARTITAGQLIAAADESLFEAKRLGRDRIVAAPAEREMRHA